MMEDGSTREVLKVQVQADPGDNWSGNGLTFDSLDAATSYAIDLMWRWTQVKAWRVVTQDGAVVKAGG